MEAKTYYEKTLSNNDPIFDEARRIGGSLCKAVGKATWFVKDYLQCFLLSVLFDLLPVKAKKDATAGERGLNYAMSTIMALLVVGMCSTNLFAVIYVISALDMVLWKRKKQPHISMRLPFYQYDDRVFICFGTRIGHRRRR